jgi:1-deoxy-D-xylulose 5-phosphate reductoisomerase
MALSIPIVSEFDGKGIDKAIKEFKQLETVGEKAQFAIKKAAVPAAAALTAVAGALGLAAKAAAEDEQQQAILANKSVAIFASNG